MICEHFLRGKCRYGEQCFKSHVSPPLYKKAFDAKSTEIAQKSQPMERKEKVVNNRGNNIKKVQKPNVVPGNPSEKNKVQKFKETEDVGEKSESRFKENKTPMAKTVVPNLSNAEKKRLKKEKKRAAALDENLKQVEILKNQGKKELQERQYSSAVKLYSEAIVLSGTTYHSVLFNDRAAAYLLMDNHKAALNDSRKIVEHEPEHAEAHNRIVICCLALGKVDKARASLKKFTSLGLNNEYTLMVKQLDRLEMLQNKVVDLLKRRKYKEAAVNLDLAMKVSSHNPGLITLKAQLFAMQKDVVRARKELDKLDSKSSSVETSVFHFVKGLCDYYDGDLDRAVSEFTIAKKDISEAESWHSKAKKVRDAFVAGHIIIKRADDYNAAMEAFNSALKADSDHTKQLAKLYFSRARVFEKFGKVKEALSDCSNSIDNDPAHHQAWCKRGELRILQEMFEEGIKDLEEAHRLNPSFSYHTKLEDAKRRKENLPYEKMWKEKKAEDEKRRKEKKAEEERRKKEKKEEDERRWEKIEAEENNRREERRAEWGKRRRENNAGGKPTHYQVLSVDDNASLDVIKKAYRAKAREFHPDKHANASPGERAEMESRMKEITAAHSCLSDTEKRKAYDRKLDGFDEEDSDDDDNHFHFDVNDFFMYVFGRMFMSPRGKRGFRTPNFYF